VAHFLKRQASHARVSANTPTILVPLEAYFIRKEAIIFTASG